MNVSHTSPFPVCRSVRWCGSSFAHNTGALQRCFGEIDSEDSLAFTRLIKSDPAPVLLRNLLCESQSKPDPTLSTLTYKRQKYLLANGWRYPGTGVGDSNTDRLIVFVKTQGYGGRPLA